MAGAGIERGDEEPRRTGFPRPLAKSGLDLAFEVLDPGLGISGANPDDGQLYPLALLVSGVPQVWPAPSFDPDPVLRERVRPRPSSFGSLDPAFRCVWSEDHPKRRVREPGRFALSPGSPRFSAPPCPSA